MGAFENDCDAGLIGPPKERRGARADGGMSKEGVKHDDGKLPWHLFPFDAMRAVVRVLMFGAKKYAPRNWELGMDWDRVYRAAMGHMIDWWMGEKKDPETGFSHLWHAGCCIMFLIAYEIRGVGKDTRPLVLEDRQANAVPQGVQCPSEAHAQNR